MFGSASQGGEQADQLYLGMLGSLIAFLWSADEYLARVKKKAGMPPTFNPHQKI